MLPYDVSRCAGFLGDGHERCPRRFDCARFVERAGPNSPFAMSACEGGDAFVHASTVAQDQDAAHPADATPIGVLDATALRSTRAAGSQA